MQSKSFVANKAIYEVLSYFYKSTKGADMGNRAVIAFVADDGTQDKDLCLGIYLHWNGGRDSVEGFLEYAKKQGLRAGD